MAEIILWAVIASLILASIIFFASVIAKTLNEEGVTCHTCLDTGYEVGSLKAARCKHGCQENHDSPYWELAAAKQ
jgi:hypothetical protein